MTNHFERIYVINLASRTDRRADMAQQLARLGLSYETPGVVLFAAHRPADAGPFDSIGAHGCFMSHLDVLRDARARGVRSLLILEDDCDFFDVARVQATLQALRDAPQHGACDFFFGGPDLWKPAQGSVANGLATVDPQTELRTTHFVGFSAAAAAAAVPYLEAMLHRAPGDPDGGPMPVDGAYGWLRRSHPHLKTLAAHPAICAQRPSPSSIAAVKWIDTQPWARRWMARYRRAKRELRSAING